MSFSYAQAASVNPESLWAFGAIVALWALARPTTIRDYDNRPLPADAKARLFVVVCYVGLYLLGIAVTFVARDALAKVVATMPRWELAGELARQLAPDLDKGAPFLSFFALGTLLTLPAVRELERSFMVWAYNARHLHKDVELLSLHIRSCPFVASDQERLLNIEGLKAFNIFLTDTNTQAITLPSVVAWRKTAALLRQLRAWRDDAGSLLDTAQQRQLEEIAAAHERKTRLAIEIVRVLNLVSQGGGPERALSQVSSILSGAPTTGRARSTCSRHVSRAW